MGRRGAGYGSEDHLRRYLAENPSALNDALAKQTDLKASVHWLDFPVRTNGLPREFRGIEFLGPETVDKLRLAWRKFWPSSGRAHTWDAIGRTGSTWLLTEAKANHPEFCTPPTTSVGAGRKKITTSLNGVKRRLGVHRFFTWTGSYYQYANRLAVLAFLRDHEIDARLLFVYFVGDRFPDGTPCPASREEWLPLIEARRLTLGLPQQHALSAYEYKLFLPIPSSKQAAGQAELAG